MGAVPLLHHKGEGGGVGPGIWSGETGGEGHLTGTVAFHGKIQPIYGNWAGSWWGVSSLIAFSSHPLIFSQEGKRGCWFSPQRSASWGKNMVEKGAGLEGWTRNMQPGYQRHVSWLWSGSRALLWLAAVAFLHLCFIECFDELDYNSHPIKLTHPYVWLSFCCFELTECKGHIIFIFTPTVPVCLAQRRRLTNACGIIVIWNQW